MGGEEMCFQWTSIHIFLQKTVNFSAFIQVTVHSSFPPSINKSIQTHFTLHDKPNTRRSRSYKTKSRCAFSCLCAVFARFILSCMSSSSLSISLHLSLSPFGSYNNSDERRKKLRKQKTFLVVWGKSGGGDFCLHSRIFLWDLNWSCVVWMVFITWERERERMSESECLRGFNGSSSLEGLSFVYAKVDSWEILSVFHRNQRCFLGIDHRLRFDCRWTIDGNFSHNFASEENFPFAIKSETFQLLFYRFLALFLWRD